MASFNIADLTPDEVQSLAIIRKRKAHLLEEIQQIRAEMENVSAQIEALEPIEDEANPKAKQMLMGRKKFNMDPKRGMEYLIEQGLIQRTPQAVAEFLYKGEGLSKSAVGDYLGEKDEFHLEVLENFLKLHDFTDLILVQALRQFLWSFRLPGESQKIDRMMEMFANRYCELNPGVFSHPDTCYMLSFAVIMLNTFLHNPSVRDKPTLDSFVSMNRGINQGADLPKELLQSLYESIRTEPFKIPEDDGWLWKQGGRYKSWKRRWFVLNDNCLYYFEYTTDKEPRGIIPLENVKVRQVEDKSRACKTEPDGRVVEGRHTVYRMSAATHEEMNMWIGAIERSINNDPFFNMLQLRKKGVNSSRSVDRS
ncbi:hypothetical protein QR680_002094 [Steinernema hermaphroditum]|uniref:Cytohesin-1 n=1 Tax=Steinernema hermaphroditum TaxID=289476 RepID=A0AA39LGZ5_9BILA|nr:hypothetical protein QR680_002094 [Steinernema hermaphroditum]